MPSEILDDLYSSIHQGFHEYATDYSKNADKHETRTVRMIINDHIADAVKQEFVESRLIHQRVKGRNLFIYDDKVILNFKKFDENLLSSNFPTKSAKAYNNQEELEGIPANLPRVELGYIPDPAGASILGIFAVKRMGKKIDWNVDLSDHDEPKQRDLKIV